MDGHTPPKWRKSSRSSTGNCVEIMITTDSALMRDSKDRSGPVLSFGCESFALFIDALKAGESL
ncbi:DUF397 domain-containing protein [Actinoplanes sp. NPDC020271]|uniref:DUF397 domain-containing protein n=1 Tax=Actinoplanes sp. NPDC020271 TaxID=3363896 RepID=UPI00379DB8A8